MPMKKAVPAASPEAYVEALSGWRLELVKSLRKAVRGAAPLDEAIKWGHLVYFSDGPVLLIRAEDERVLFGFWRGKQLVGIEPRLKPGGKYDMATLELREEDKLAPTIAKRLTQAAVALNQSLGDPTQAAKPKGAKSPASPAAKPRKKP